MRNFFRALKRALLGGGEAPSGEGLRARRGRLGEELACAFLKRKGYKVIIRNWRHGQDELDLVCKDKETLVFVEVRARDEAALVSGYHSLTARKKEAFYRVGRAYLKALRRKAEHYRYDVVEVRLPKEPSPKKPEIFHFENIRLP